MGCTSAIETPSRFPTRDAGGATEHRNSLPLTNKTQYRTIYGIPYDNSWVTYDQIKMDYQDVTHIRDNDTRQIVNVHNYDDIYYWIKEYYLARNDVKFKTYSFIGNLHKGYYSKGVAKCYYFTPQDITKNGFTLLNNKV